MGCFEDDMDPRITPGSASTASGYSLRSKGSSAKISPFCPRSSSKLTQSIVRDHMISHYKKVYSAKAAIDTSVPKSLLYCVKYNDQLRGRGAQSSVRPQSAHVRSHRSRASCSPAQSRMSLQYEHSPYLFSGSSLASTPRPSTSFHPNSTVYPSYRAGQKQRPCSGSRHAASAYSEHGGGDQTFKAFQDPAQKTYCGDLLEKHAQRFTQDKPFTPKTLKSDKSSYLSQYRYYRAPPHPRLPHNSTSGRKITQDMEEKSQGFSTGRELSEDYLNHSHLSSSRDRDRRHKPHRVAYERTKSPPSRSVDAEEEELRYLEFITAVTDDILSRGFITDSVVERVINRHIDSNRYQLNESKMRHLLEALRKDLKEPSHSPISTLNFEARPERLVNGSTRDMDQAEVEEEPFSAVRTSDPEEYTSPSLTSVDKSEAERTFVVEEVDLSEEKGRISSHLSNQSEGSETPVKQRPTVADLGKALESLTVSEHSDCGKEEPLTSTASDDDF
uniref:Spermatogenesis associated 7 n=1 Tax=Knipowitschia caucasica TaxID=637954 RepID=A0AAV2JGS0_KNICA